MTALYEKLLVHACFADSAQPRKASNVTRPFLILWVGSGNETIIQATWFRSLVVSLLLRVFLCMVLPRVDEVVTQNGVTGGVLCHSMVANWL